MFWVMHHWYWGRAKIGDYQVISSYITAHKPYGYEHFPIFLLLGVAPQSVGKSLLTLGDCVVLLIVMNMILLRKFIFKKK